MTVSFHGPSGRLQLAAALLVGLGALGYGGYGYATQATALGSAETVEGTVVSTSVETVDQRRGTGYRPQATFNYTYEGERYTSSKVYPGALSREFDSESKARAQLEGYEPGANVTAYVLPDSPGEAYLLHESDDKPLLVAGFGLLSLLWTAVSVLRG